MIRKLLRSAAVLSALAVSATVAQAQVYNTAAPYVGSISQPNITAGGNYTNLSVAWNIAQEGDLLRYTYTFSGFTAPAVSHIILTLSDNCATNFATCVSGATVNGVAQTDLSFGSFSDSPSNPGFPGSTSIFGVKINTPEGVDGFVFSFLSGRVPVYGDFYAKGGADSYAYNDGLLDHASTNPANFIARPDTDFGGGQGSVVPEPSTYLLLGSGLLGLAGIARRRRSNG